MPILLHCLDLLTASHLLSGRAAIADIARARAGSHSASHRRRGWAATRSGGRLRGQAYRPPAASPHQYRAAASPARYGPARIRRRGACPRPGLGAGLVHLRRLNDSQVWRADITAGRRAL